MFWPGGKARQAQKRPAVAAQPPGGSGGYDSSSSQNPGYANPFGAAGQPGQQDPMELLRQLMSGEAAKGGVGMPGVGGMPGAGGAGGMENPLAAMLAGAGGQQQKKTTDGFFTERIPLLKKIKRPVLIAFFSYCFYRGWVQKWGFLQGLMASSYFDMLAVPLRVLPGSPTFDRPYLVTQIYVQYFFQLLGYIINVAKGKAKFPPDFKSMLAPQGGAGAANPFAPGANPFGAAGGAGANPFEAVGGAGAANPFADLGANPFGAPAASNFQAPPASPTDMPTAPTVGTPPPQPSTPMAAQAQATAYPASRPPPPRTAPPVIDADVTFLD